MYFSYNIKKILSLYREQKRMPFRHPYNQKLYKIIFSSYCLIFLGIFLFLYSLHSTPLCFKLFIDRYFRVVWAAMRGVEGR